MNMSNSGKMMQNSCTVGQAQLECFESLTPEELMLIESKMVTVTYKRCEMICKQGSLANHIIFIRDGLVKLFLEGPAENLILQIMPSSNIIGLSNCFGNNNLFYYSAQAYLDTEVDLLDMETFKTLINSNAKFASKMIESLAEHSVITYGRFYCLTQKQNYGRFADILLCLTNRIYKSCKFPMQLSRKELAELAGMSVESVSRIMTRFKEEKIIEEKDGFVEILQIDKLKDISLKG